MSLLDENIEIPFESLLIGNGWKKELITTYNYRDGLVSNITYTYKSNDVNDNEYRITYYPAGSYLYGKRVRKPIANVKCTIKVYEYDYNNEVVRTWRRVEGIHIRCKQSDLFDLWVRVRNGIFNPNLYKMYK